MRLNKNVLAMTGLSFALIVAACDGSDKPTTSATEDEVRQSSAPASPAVQPPAASATGNVIEVRMVTDGAANYFEPAEVTASQGDVIRFVLDSGLHNVSFPAAENPGKAGLPGPSPYLQTPGQTYDMTVDLQPGEYTFQCDPHIMMGMFGTLTVN